MTARGIFPRGPIWSSHIDLVAGAREATRKAEVTAACPCIITVKPEVNGMPKKDVLTGKRFNNLVVVSESEERRDGRVCWNCLCDCGNVTIVKGSSLKSGNTKSCGCRNHKKKHGDVFRGPDGKKRSTKLYSVWKAMKDRIFNVKNKFYNIYGGRGITITEDWLEYVNFKKWALTSGYEEGLYIDRINNDMGYTPENCRWVDSKTSARNRRCLVLDAEKVEEIKRLRNNGLKYRELVDIFGTDTGTLCKVVHGEIWG